MSILRNREVRIQFIIEICITLAATVGCLFFNPVCAIICLCLGAGLVTVNLVYLKKRYGRLQEMARTLDRILHGEEGALISESDEGELAILNTELRKMTLRLKLQSEQLMDEKIRLTHAIEDIFHQMRTPLTSINLVISLLEEENLPYNKRVRLTRELKKQTKRLHWMVEALLKMSKIDAGTAGFVRADVPIKEIIASASDAFLIPLELKGVELETEVDDGDIFCDRDWTAEALANIIKNCMEHTPEGGKIRISASCNALGCEITIKDTGTGFDRDDIPYLFDRFYKGANASSESIGIGLALSRMIISAQDGTIKACNSPEGGAMFVIKIFKGII